LSPIPGFREWLKGRVARGFAPADKRATPKLRKALAAVAPHLPTITGAVGELRNAGTPLTPLKRELTTLCAAYLLGVGEENGTSTDAVAKFHLNNGARLDRLNWCGDDSDKGLKQSLGMMVNYVYEPKRIERNHEQFVRGKTIASSEVEDLV
jgi:malonyl-CoA decarboxylase